MEEEKSVLGRHIVAVMVMVMQEFPMFCKYIPPDRFEESSKSLQYGQTKRDLSIAIIK